MKKWVWIVVVVAGGFLASQFVEKDAEDYSDYARDVLYVQTPDSQYVGGEVIITKVVGSNWSPKEKGEELGNSVGLRFAVITLDLTEAEGNSITAYPETYKVDAVATPQAIIER